jgi:hypothetical protein
VAGAAAGGHGLLGLQQALRGLGIDLLPAQQAVLGRWHDQGLRLVLQPALLLRTRSSTEMQAIVENPLLVAVIGELVSPTTAMVASSAAETAARLAEAGLQVMLPFAVKAAASGSSRAEQTAGVRWLAGRLYTWLSSYVALPLPPSLLHLDELGQAMGALAQARLESAFAQLECRLLDLLDGRMQTLPPAPSDPGQWMAPLQAAIEAEGTVQIDYFTAGRNLLTRRTIQPYWLEERRGVGYVRAYCHSAERVLVFRLDRIQALQAATG